MKISHDDGKGETGGGRRSAYKVIQENKHGLTHSFDFVTFLNHFVCRYSLHFIQKFDTFLKYIKLLLSVYIITHKFYKLYIILYE